MKSVNVAEATGPRASPHSPRKQPKGPAPALPRIPGSDRWVHFFWHQDDDVTLTSRGYFWTYPGKSLTTKSIAVLPEISEGDNFNKCAGICTDFVLAYAHKEVNI